MSSAGRPKTYASSERRTDVIRAAPDAASPSSTAGFANFGSARNGSTHSSPTTTRYKDILESPNWRRSGGFVRQSAASSDDPFVSDKGAGQDTYQGKLGAFLASKHTTLTCQVGDQIFNPREDRAGVRLSGDNAQAILPPNACVFVAK